ncbi:MAG: hypothetical protein KI791_12170 [Cyclobacteriaceae bacterium]|nr:hypothetical protein [Cyclobacteriaceae bacterium SS2]
MADKRIPFFIKAINTLEFATLPNIYKKEENVRITTNFQIGIDEKNNGIAVLLELNYTCNKNPFIIFKIQNEFGVDNDSFESFKNTKENKIIVPKGFLNHLAAMTVGTVRGVLHEKLKKTEFSEFLLPAIDVSEIPNEDMEYPLEQVAKKKKA